jgi:hypothetical protein
MIIGIQSKMICDYCRKEIIADERYALVCIKRKKPTQFGTGYNPQHYHLECMHTGGTRFIENRGIGNVIKS